jgi:hypothetical protein
LETHRGKVFELVAKGVGWFVFVAPHSPLGDKGGQCCQFASFQVGKENGEAGQKEEKIKERKEKKRKEKKRRNQPFPPPPPPPPFSCRFQFLI